MAISVSLLRPVLFTCAVSGINTHIPKIQVGGCSGCVSSWYFNNRHSNGWKGIRQKGTLSQVVRWWQSQPFHDKFFYSVASLNALVWLSWKSKRIQPFLLKYFITSPSSHTSSLLLCTFSHMEVWHLAINMAVLWSFIPSFVGIIGEQWTWPFYLTSGTFAAMCGHYFKLSRAGLSLIPSLGASGALLAVASLVIINNPESSVYIIFLPFIPIPAYVGLVGIVSFDVIGVLRGWKMFDHAAHLGGIMFGVCSNYLLGQKK